MKQNMKTKDTDFIFITDNEKLRNTNKTYATNFDFTIVIGCIES